MHERVAAVAHVRVGLHEEGSRWLLGLAKLGAKIVVCDLCKVPVPGSR